MYSYDDTISTEVPLNRILDNMIDVESNDTVVKFLRQYDIGQLNGIFSHSLKFSRIFQYDFIRKMDYIMVKWLVDLVPELERDAEEVGLYFTWQIMQRKNVPDALLESCKNTIRKTYTSDLRHPYSGGRSGMVSQEYDIQIYNEIDKGGNISNLLNGLDSNSFTQYVKYYLGRSLYKYRIIQEDVCYGLDPAHLYIMITNFPTNQISYAHHTNFTHQVLFSDRIDNGAKILLLENTSVAWNYENMGDRDVINRVMNSDDYSEILMTLDLAGDVNVNYEDILFNVMIRKPWIIRDIYDNCPEYLVKYLPVGDLPESKEFIERCNEHNT